MAVGNVFIVGIVGLMTGWLLNAPGIEKTAQGMSLGWRRDVAVGFAGPMADISRTFQLDRPREWIQGKAGREGEDDISVALPSPTTLPEGATTTSTRPEDRPAFSPEVPLRVWVGGDSLSITPGESLISRLDASGAATAVAPVDGQVSTGLARPEIFNWPQHLNDVVAQYNPDALVLTIGSNDDQNLTNAPDGGSAGPVGSQEWQDEYRRRVGGLMDSVAVDGRVLIYVGIPLIRDTDRYYRGYDIMNKIVADEAAKRPGRAYYVPTSGPLANADGSYADYLLNSAGQLVQVRTGDGIHFTRAGGDRMADEMMKQILAAFDLDSWRKPKAPTTTTIKAKTKKATTTTKKKN
jgi:hypothetical protein